MCRSVLEEAIKQKLPPGLARLVRTRYRNAATLGNLLHEINNNLQLTGIDPDFPRLANQVNDTGKKAVHHGLLSESEARLCLQTVDEPEKAAAITKSVQKLKEFKAYLSSQTTRQLFSDPNQLDAQVTAALSQFQPQTAHSTSRVWKPLVCHALQPAPHFRGRAPILNELKEWLMSPITPDRVLSLVAAGGTGKTALVNEAMRQATFSGRAGVLVWSFYEDAHTDNFLRAAYLYFTGKDDAPAGGMLERLQMVLAGDAPHVLILDGLEERKPTKVCDAAANSKTISSNGF